MNTRVAQTQAHWAKMLPLIQAFTAGEEIEYAAAAGGPFAPAPTPRFAQGCYYRIKPKPQWRAYKDSDDIPKVIAARHKETGADTVLLLSRNPLAPNPPLLFRTCNSFPGVGVVTSHYALPRAFTNYDRINPDGSTSPLGVLE